MPCVFNWSVNFLTALLQFISIDASTLEMWYALLGLPYMSITSFHFHFCLFSIRVQCRHLECQTKLNFLCKSLSPLFFSCHIIIFRLHSCVEIYICIDKSASLYPCCLKVLLGTLPWQPSLVFLHSVTKM